jgi:hypothetical protein
VKALSGTAPPFTVDATGGVADPVDVVPESDAEATGVVVIKLLEDVLEAEPEAFPDPPEVEDEDDVLDPDDVGADDNPTELEPDPPVEEALDVALVRT